MAKKNRTAIPQINKVRALLQQEINSKCPLCKDKNVGHFEIHHIDEDPSNNDTCNLILLCPTCHSKINKKDISIEEITKVKQQVKNKNADIQFISVTIDSENCGWEPIEDAINAFQAVRLKSLFPIFNFTFINNSEKTILLTNIELATRRLPMGLSGPIIEIPSILRPIIKYKIRLPEDGKTINTILNDEIVVPKSVAFKFQVEVFKEYMESFTPPHNKYALNFKFGFNNDFYVDAPKIMLNSSKDYDKLIHVGYN